MDELERIYQQQAEAKAFWDSLLESAGVCASKGSVPVTSRSAAEQAMYQQLANQQYKLSPYTDTVELANGYVLTRKAIEDNQYLAEAYRANPVKQEVAAPKAPEPEPTVEDLKRRHERKLDLSD